MFAFFQEWDASVLYWIQQNLRSDFMNFLMKGISFLGDHGIFMIVVTAILLIFKKTRRCGLVSAVALILGTVVVNLVVKPIFMRPRPYITLTGFEALLRMDRDPNSFPSGHTQAAFSLAVAVLLACRYNWIKITLSIFALLMAFSRLYVGVHYPSDVLFGALIGTATALIAFGFLRLAEKKVPPEKLRWMGEPARAVKEDL